MNGRRRYPKQDWYDFGKQLLKYRGSDEQKKFLEVCLSREAFLDYMDEHLSMEGIEGDGALGSFDHAFTEMEFVEPPFDTTQRLVWEAFTPVFGSGEEENYADGCFWGVVVREMIERNLVETTWLAANASDTHEDAGIANIENALDAEDDSSEKAVDDCVRRVLRSMCNPAPRGARIVFNDFSLGKSWWRWCWASRMAEILDIDRDDILQHILTGRNYATIAAKMHSGRSYLSPENVFGGLILFLNGRKKSPLSSKRIGKIIDELAYQSAWRAIELHSPEENREEIERLHRALPDV